MLRYESHLECAGFAGGDELYAVSIHQGWLQSSKPLFHCIEICFPTQYSGSTSTDVTNFHDRYKLGWISSSFAAPLITKRHFSRLQSGRMKHKTKGKALRYAFGIRVR
ncbi:hypothetical protein TNCV_3209861 [Trichonephila clavipes]|nr:hypothetical protein TNCV_3209861 [Trichonephila clavipes]